MALKRKSRTRVIVELPPEVRGRVLLKDNLANKIYAMVVEELKGVDTDIDVEIDYPMTPLDHVRAGLEDIKAGRVVKFETVEDLLRDEE